MIGEILNKIVTFFGISNKNSVKKNNHTWRDYARNKNGKAIHEGLNKEMSGVIGVRVRELVYESCKLDLLAKTLPSQVINYIIEESIKGQRSKGIAENVLKMFPEIEKQNIEIIAQSITSKTSTALTQARSQKNGINYYIWRCNHDSRTRKSHLNLDDVIVRWDDPPDEELLIGGKSDGKHNAGNALGCRCYPQSVVFLDYITFPHKIYANGKITTITRSQFEKIWKK